MKHLILRTPTLFLLVVCGILSPPSGAIAQEAKSASVVDLGEMSINGELKRPTVQWIESKKALRPELPKIAQKELERLEEELLRPAPLPASYQRQEVSHASKN